MSPNALTLESIVARNPDLMLVNVDDEVVILNMSTSRYYGMRKVGKYIWEFIEQPARIGDVCTRLLEVFDVDQATCQREVLAFLESMRSQDLLRVTEISR